MSRVLSGPISKRRFLEVLLVGGAGSILAACSPAIAPVSTSAPAPAAPAPAAATAPAKPTAAAPSKGGTLNYAESSDFTDFNPWSFTATNFEAYNQIFSRLFWKDGTGKINPDLATTWQMAADNLSFTVTLRQNAKWHDGKAVTAQDFVDMYGYLKDDALSKYSGVSKVKGIMTPVTKLTAPDASTLVFGFDKPTPYVTDILDYFYAVRIGDKTDPGFMNAAPIGTGPFKFTKYVPNQYVQMDRFADFYNQGQPLLDTFMFKRFSQAETLASNLKSGAVDDVLLASLSDVGPLQSDGTYNVEPNENSGSIFDVIVNVKKPPLDNRLVRQALSYAMNREGMAKSAFFGVSRPLVSPFYATNSLAYRQDLVTAHPFDLQKAQSLLQQAGVANLQLTTISQPAMPQQKLYMLIWQSDLAKIGVKLTVNEVENAAFNQMSTAPDLGGMDIMPHLTGRTTRDPAIFFSTQGPYRAGELNVFGYRNADFESLVAQGAVEPDPAKRATIYQQLNQMLCDEVFMIPLATNPRIWASSKAVKGVQIDLAGNLYLAGASVST